MATKEKEKAEEVKSPCIRERLLRIQRGLKAPKNQYNEFGKYKYRNAEDILEAVKPLCEEHGAVLTLSDEIVVIGDRYYVKAMATLVAVDLIGDLVSTVAYAREEQDKKGMDGAQVTGASSSYARKYALNGLFCIDDTKDPDATNTHGKDAASQQQPKAAVQAAPAQPKNPVPGKAVDAWKRYVAMPSHKGLSATTLKSGFNAMRAKAVGEAKDVTRYTEDDWKKVDAALDAMAIAKAEAAKAEGGAA